MGVTALAFVVRGWLEASWLVLIWVAFVPWLAALDEARSIREAAATGLLLSVLMVLATFTWFAQAIGTYTGSPLPVSLGLLLLLSPLVEPQFVAAAIARHVARRSAASPWRTALVGAGAWVGTEWAWPKLFADTIGHGLYPSIWMRQAADLGGAGGLSVAILLANEAVLAALRRVQAGDRRGALGRAAIAPGIVGALVCYGAIRCAGLASAEPPVRAGVVQAGIAHYDQLAAEVGTYEAVRRILDAHFAMSEALVRRDDPDLLVWPETVYPTTFGTPKSPDGAAFDDEITAFVARMRRPLVFGTYAAEAGDEYNAAVILEPGASRFEAYRKAALFPLTERVPALLDSGVVRRWFPWLGSWKAGTGAGVLPLRLRDGRTLQVAPLICYDAIDPRLAADAVRRGAELMVTISNDSWFATGGGPRLHLIVSAFRSIETRRPMVRGTNTGISAVIDPAGTLLDATRVGERRTMLAAVRPERRAWTLVLAWGDWLGPAGLAAAVLLLALSVLGRRAGPTATGVAPRRRAPNRG